MDDKLMEKLYDSIVEDGFTTYVKLFNELEIEEDFIDYWKKALMLYQSFDGTEKEVFFSILKTVMVDTVSTVFGILDGTVSLVNGVCDFGITANGVDVKGEMQDEFLRYVEDLEA